uniref:Uncharacterized protein n=1 Tax=Arundo donax TaxID=35708 RepID=A0A0A9AY57_ARUDO
MNAIKINIAYVKLN